MNRTQIGLLFLGVLIVVGGIVYAFMSLRSGVVVQQTDNQPVPVMKVGEETIYSSTVQSVLDFYEEDEQPQRKIELLDMMAKESVALQAGKEEGLVTLNKEIYNSNILDRTKRLLAVKKVEEAISAKSSSISADVVTLWYKNQGQVSSLGEEQGAIVAQEQLSILQQQVVSGTLSMQQAAEAISNNSDNAQLDSNYQNNALFSLSGNNDERFTSITGLRELIWRLNEGDVSEVTRITSDEETSAFYAFVKVNSKRNEEISSVENWYELKTPLYEKILY